jgi:two-component system alkaline phosphatase synthesis response regulator PhoP
MPKEHILVVDDEEDILELVRYNLSKEGYAVQCVTSGEEGLKLSLSTPPDLVILDLMLPGVDGLDVCKTLKQDSRTKDIPVIMLSARGEEADIVSGLEIGADDYVVKPFSPRVLSARVKNALRKSKPQDTQHATKIEYGPFTISPARHEVLVEGQSIDLTASEFKLLVLVTREPGRVFTRSQIVDAVHGEDYPVTDRSVDVLIVGVRKKLGNAGELIETVRGVGYRMKDLS